MRVATTTMYSQVNDMHCYFLCGIFFLMLATVEYSNDTDIEVFVLQTAAHSNRNKDKALEWVHKLQDQDIMTVGDLRDLHDEDWAGIGLTVFALRALKNSLMGRKQQQQQRSRATSSGANTPVDEQDQFLS